MLFWSFVLAFVLGLLYYNMDPRSNSIDVYDKPMAETAIVAFINSHQAAKKTLYHTSVENGEPVIVMDYDFQMRLVPATVPEVDKRYLRLFLSQSKEYQDDKLGHIDSNIRNTATVGLNHTKLDDIFSFVACIKMSTDASGTKKELTFACDNKGTQNYIVTYMTHPAWWNNDIATKELWRSAMLRRSKGSDECGVLYPRSGVSGGGGGQLSRPAVTGLPRYDVNSEYVLDNSQRYIVSIPTEITAMMKKNLAHNGVSQDLSDYLFCITPIANIIRNAQTRTNLKQSDPETTPEVTAP